MVLVPFPVGMNGGECNPASHADSISISAMKHLWFPLLVAGLTLVGCKTADQPAETEEAAAMREARREMIQAMRAAGVSSAEIRALEQELDALERERKRMEREMKKLEAEAE